MNGVVRPTAEGKPELHVVLTAECAAKILLFECEIRKDGTFRVQMTDGRSPVGLNKVFNNVLEIAEIPEVFYIKVGRKRVPVFPDEVLDPDKLKEIFASPTDAIKEPGFNTWEQVADMNVKT